MPPKAGWKVGNSCADRRKAGMKAEPSICCDIWCQDAASKAHPNLERARQVVGDSLYRIQDRATAKPAPDALLQSVYDLFAVAKVCTTRLVNEAFARDCVSSVADVMQIVTSSTRLVEAGTFEGISTIIRQLMDYISNTNKVHFKKHPQGYVVKYYASGILHHDMDSPITKDLGLAVLLRYADYMLRALYAPCAKAVQAMRERHVQAIIAQKSKNGGDGVLQAALERIAQLEKQLNAANKEKKDADAKAKSMGEQLKAVQAQLETAQRRGAARAQELETAEKQLKTAKAAVDTKTRLLEEVQADSKLHQEELQVAQEQLRKARTDVLQLTSRLQASEAAVKDKTKQLADALAAQSQSQAQLAAARAAVAAAGNGQAEAENSLVQALAAEQEGTQGMRTAYTSLVIANEALEEAAAEAAAIGQSLDPAARAALDVQVAQATAAAEAASKKQAEAEARASKAEEQLCVMSVKISEAKKQVAALTERCSAAEAKSAAVQRELEANKAALAFSNMQIVDMRVRLAPLEAQVAHRSMQLAATREKLVDAEGRVKSAEASAAAARKELAMVKEYAKSLEQRLAESHAAYAQVLDTLLAEVHTYTGAHMHAAAWQQVLVELDAYLRRERVKLRDLVTQDQKLNINSIADQRARTSCAALHGMHKSTILSVWRWMQPVLPVRA